MIRDLSNAEKEINDFMKACREWLEAGKPPSRIFRKDRAICESLVFFMGSGVKPVTAMDDYEQRWMQVREVKNTLKDQFIMMGFDTVYPFNHPILSGMELVEPDDHYFIEVHNGTVWDNEDRVDFVMNFKPLKETDDEK